MRSAVLVALLSLVAPSLRSDPLPLLTPAAAAGEWGPLVGALASKGALQAGFTERRYFPFRNRPTILHGILRISPDRGLSLQYTEPEASTLIADRAGLAVRDAAGRTSVVPADSREAGAIASMLPIMQFNLDALFPRFEIRAARTSLGWRFEFTPRDPVAAGTLGTITVDGTAEDVTHLEFRHSERQRVEIDVEDPRSGLTFTPAELAASFR
jgi:hypothetical protein